MIPFLIGNVLKYARKPRASGDDPTSTYPPSPLST